MFRQKDQQVPDYKVPDYKVGGSLADRRNGGSQVWEAGEHRGLSMARSWVTRGLMSLEFPLAEPCVSAMETLKRRAYGPCPWEFSILLGRQGKQEKKKGSYSSLRCVGFSLWWLLLLRSMGSRHAGFSSCGSRAQ